VRWAVYLGFLRRVSRYSGTGGSEEVVLPDPTEAVRRVLPALVEPGRTVPISEVVARLAGRLPVLDGGTYRLAVHAQGAPPSETACSPTLSLALARLEHAGVIRLEVGAGDAEKTVLADNRGAFHALQVVTSR
jgi:hypothetical protein